MLLLKCTMCDTVAAKGHKSVDLGASLLMKIYCIIASEFCLPESLSLDYRHFYSFIIVTLYKIGVRTTV